MALSKGGNKGKSNVVDLFPSVSNSERIVMSLNASAVGKIMDRLTDLYNDPIQATVREIVSNALDTSAEARLEGKNPAPVKITTPNAFDPVFTVEDNGMGMSKTIIKEVVAEYGASTKENSFNQVGAYGLGFKAPLAYCNEFYFTTTRDGETSEVVISRLETGPETNILQVKSTNNKPGTQVRVPVRNNQYDFDRFKETIEIYKAYAFTMNEPIIIDEVEYSSNNDFFGFNDITIEQEHSITGRVWFNKKKLFDVLKTINTSSYYQKIELKVGYVLSGFLYDDPKWTKSYYDNSEEADLIVELKPGIVEFSSSRDQIMKDDRLEGFDSLVKSQIFNENYIFKNLVQYYKSMESDQESYEFSDKINHRFVDNNVVFQLIGTESSAYSVNLESLYTINGANPFAENYKFNKEANFLGAVLPLMHDRKKFDLLSRNNSSNNDEKLVNHSNWKVSSVNDHLEKQLYRTSLENTYFLNNLEKIRKEVAKYRVNNTIVVYGMDDSKKISSVIRNRSNMDSVSAILLVKDVVDEDLQKIIKFRFSNVMNIDFYSFTEFNEHVKSFKKSQVEQNTSEEKSKTFTIIGKVLEPVNTLKELYAVEGSHARSYEVIEVDEHVNNNALFIPVHGKALYEIPSILNGVYHAEGESLFGRSIVIVADPKKDFFDYVTDNKMYASGHKYTARSKTAISRLEGRIFNRDIVQDKISAIPEKERLTIHYLNVVHQLHYERYIQDYIKGSDQDNPVKKLLETLQSISADVPTGSNNLIELSKVLTNALNLEYNVDVESVNPSRVFSSFSDEVQKDFTKKLELIQAIKDPVFARYSDSSKISELKSMTRSLKFSKQDYLKEALSRRINEIVGEVLEEKR